ncbi:MAG: lipocalin family protein [Planctomycetota bacterium]
MIRALLPLLLLIGCRSSGALPGAAPLASVESFELERYLGTWYEISKYPVSFEKGLVGVTATYSMREDGRVKVENAGLKGDFDGKRKVAVGKAWMPDPERPSRLKVSFFGPFSGNYWVIALDENYQWSVVGEPDRKYLWILSRTPKMGPKLYESVVQRVEELGYDTSRLELMPQRP